MERDSCIYDCLCRAGIYPYDRSNDIYFPLQEITSVKLKRARTEMSMMKKDSVDVLQTPPAPTLPLRYKPKYFISKKIYRRSCVIFAKFFTKLAL